MNDNLKEMIGGRVRDIRIKQRLTQAEFAEKIDISINFLSEIENGKKGMSQETIYKICNTFHISADRILFGEESSSSPERATSDMSERLTSIAGKYSKEELEYGINYLISLKQMRERNL